MHEYTVLWIWIYIPGVQKKYAGLIYDNVVDVIINLVKLLNWNNMH